mmetsp:Transcript_1711/g.3671  ORF Transcript_1711/g.3671 Transcript_1711/m.3671 type:complete len:659 (-) Transcript_1711:67-2043(-)
MRTGQRRKATVGDGGVTEEKRDPTADGDAGSRIKRRGSSVRRSESQDLMREQGLVPRNLALKILGKVDLLRESNALSVDIGGSLTKLMYLQHYASGSSAKRNVNTRVSADEVKVLKKRTKSLLIDELDTNRPLHLAVDVPVLNGVVHFFTFETRYIEECVHFISRHWHTFHRAPALASGAENDKSKGLQESPRVAPTRMVRATGGGAYKYSDLFRNEIGVELCRIDEMASTVAGLNFLLEHVPGEVYEFVAGAEPIRSLDLCRRFVDFHPNDRRYPYLLVNIGSGVSILRVSGPGQFDRVSGSSLGGGTFWGLSRLLTNCKTFDEVIELTKQGENAHVDMMVGDIYGTDYEKLGLPANVIAASFGKVSMKKESNSASCRSMWTELKRAVLGTMWLWLNVALAAPVIGPVLRRFELDRMAHETLANGQLRSLFKAPDVSLSLLRMVSYNIGQIAFLNAKRYGLQHIYFAGNFIRDHPFTVSTLSYAVNFWSEGQMQARFLVHDGYLGALGAYLNADSTPAISSPPLAYSSETEYRAGAADHCDAAALESLAKLREQCVSKSNTAAAVRLSEPTKEAELGDRNLNGRAQEEESSKSVTRESNQPKGSAGELRLKSDGNTKAETERSTKQLDAASEDESWVVVRSKKERKSKVIGAAARDE